jgi:hypothetical protein
MTDLDPSTLFGVKGLVTVITGGGTGNFWHIVDVHVLIEM